MITSSIIIRVLSEVEICGDDETTNFWSAMYTLPSVPFYLPWAFRLSSNTFCFATRRFCTGCCRPGHKYEHAPHSIQSRIWYFSHFPIAKLRIHVQIQRHQMHWACLDALTAPHTCRALVIYRHIAAKCQQRRRPFHDRDIERYLRLSHHGATLIIFPAPF